MRTNLQQHDKIQAYVTNKLELQKTHATTETLQSQSQHNGSEPQHNGNVSGRLKAAETSVMESHRS